MLPSTTAAAHRRIRSWYLRLGRDLPWRRTRYPYAVLVSEVMLQQTQVDRVVPKYHRFLAEFPTLAALARAKFASVLRAWSGLGYNSRARRLWECARAVVRDHGGRLPADAAKLAALPGIGRYTAAALLSFAFDEPVPVVDTNIRRVLLRSVDGANGADMARAWRLAERMLPVAHTRDWNQAMMDVGALFCRPAPRCERCPATSYCRYRAKKRKPEGQPDAARKRQAPFLESRRYYRGRIVKALVAKGSLRLRELGEQVKPGFDQSEMPWLRAIVGDLARENLIAFDARTRRVRIA